MPLLSYNVSKWIKHQVLLDGDEMEMLLEELSPFFLFNVSEIATNPQVTKGQFLGKYKEYVEGLKEGKIIEARRDFSPVFSTIPEAVCIKEVRQGYFLTKPLLPVVQLQLHQFLPSNADGKFYPMALSPESISWGIQFAYPQIFQNSQDQTYAKVDATFPNTPLFSKLVKWLRAFSSPTTFVWNGVKTATPIRLGRKCFDWIQAHPQLIAKGIAVHVY